MTETMVTTGTTTGSGGSRVLGAVTLLGLATLLLFAFGFATAVTFIELSPTGERYDHNARWGDGNGYSHVRAALLGPSITAPIVDGRTVLGTWQQIILCDFDNQPRTRKIVVQVMGIVVP